MKFNSDDLSPWAEFDRMASNASALRVVIGDKVHRGMFDATLTSDRVLEIKFPEAKKKGKSSK